MPQPSRAGILFLSAAIFWSLTASSSAEESANQPALSAAARGILPTETQAHQFAKAIESGLWNPARTALAVTIRQSDATLVFVFLKQDDGSFLARDVSRVESGNFGKLGHPRSAYERFATEPVEWLERNDEWLQVRIRTRVWKNGQRDTVSEPLLIKPDGTVLYR